MNGSPCFLQKKAARIEAIKQCVIAGLGIAALPQMVVERELSEGRIVDLGWKSPQPPLFTQLAWHKDKWLSPPLKDFIDISREFLQEDREEGGI